MAVQGWRWWQWVMASLVVGAALGYAFTRLDVDDTSIATRDLGFFVRHLNQRTDAGDSIVDGIRVSPPVTDVRGKKIENVTFWVRAKHKTTGSWDRIAQYQIRTERPLFAKSPSPEFGIRDFLAEQKKDIPTLDFRYNFYQEPRAIWAMSLGGSVLGIGILWPLCIRLMVKLGLGMPESPREAGIDLSRVSSRSPAAAAAGIGVTEGDRDQLDALNERLEANVSGMLIEKEELDEAQERRAEEAVIKQLAGQPLQAEEIVPAADQGPREFGGEFYPVARPVVKKEDA